MNQPTLTSADRILIARIVDLAIDVTLQGRYQATAAYIGGSHALDVWYRKVGQKDRNPINTIILFPTNPDYPPQPTFRDELVSAIHQLEALLIEPEARL